MFKSQKDTAVMHLPIAIAMSSMLLVAFFNHQVRGEVRQVELPVRYTDFAMHPETGDIAALDATSNRVDIFNISAINEEKTQPITRVAVGASPAAVVYKRFQDVQGFAVVCAKDSCMYWISSGGREKNAATDFKLVKKIELLQRGALAVSSSTNPNDPFLYYSFRDGHDSTTGVVSLRDMRDHGEVFESAIDCEISANGKVAYTRGSGSPTGFESQVLTNSLVDDKPKFVRLFYDHSTTMRYVPGPWGRYTATGNGVFSHSLSKKEAELNFVPYCFFKSQPVIVGLVEDSRQSARNRAPVRRSTLTMRAASYNSLMSFGEKVVITRKPPLDGGQSTQRRSSENDPRHTDKRTRVFADDVRKRVVYADEDMICFVPLSEFNLPKEPIVLAKLIGESSLTCGEEHVMNLVPFDASTKVTVDDMPPGMNVIGSQLSWRPAPDQVGTATIDVTTKWGALEKSQRFELDVAYPSIPLPFSVGGFSIAPSEDELAIWEGAPYDQYGRPKAAAPGPSRLAILQLKSGEVIAERKVAETIGWIVFSDDHVFLTAQQATAERCEVLRRSDLERVATIVASGPIQNMELAGGVLAIQSEREIDLYDAVTFERLRTFPVRGEPSRKIVSGSGILIDNVLYGFGLEPKYVRNPAGVPIIGTDRRLVPRMIPGFGEVSQTEQQMRRQQLRAQPSSGKIAEASVGGVAISLERTRQQAQVPGATHTWRNTVEITLRASGLINERQTLVRRSIQSKNGSQPQPSPCLMQATQQAAYVLHEARLYRWDIPRKNETTEILGEASTDWLYEQSAVSIGLAGKTELHHKLVGAKPPIAFSTVLPPSFAELDPATGTIKLDNEVLFDRALSAVETLIKQRNRGEAFAQTLRTQIELITPKATLVLGRRPSGFPVAIAVHISASDADLASRIQNYFVFVEVPATKLLEKLSEAEKEREKQAAAALERQLGKQAAADKESQEVAKELQNLKRQVDSLEQRLELMTRQLNMLLKQLDDK